jgi:hypothetical protein
MAPKKAPPVNKETTAPLLNISKHSKFYFKECPLRLSGGWVEESRVAR